MGVQVQPSPALPPSRPRNRRGGGGRVRFNQPPPSPPWYGDSGSRKEILLDYHEGDPSWSPRRRSFLVTKKKILLGPWLPRRKSFSSTKKEIAKEDIFLGYQKGDPALLPSMRVFLVATKEILLGRQDGLHSLSPTVRKKHCAKSKLFRHRFRS